MSPVSVLTLAAVLFTILGASGAIATPLTFTITEVVAGPDQDELTRGDADMYAWVIINCLDGNDANFNTFNDVISNQGTIHPNWTFTKDCAGSAASVLVWIFERDDCNQAACNGFNLTCGAFCELCSAGCNPDDLFDVDPNPAQHAFFLSVDMATGLWSGDTTADCIQGDDPNVGTRVCFDVNVQGATGDTDGDGLADGWEQSGLDSDGNGTVDSDEPNLPALGADRLRHDVFLEVDCLVSDGNGNGMLGDPQDHSHCPIENAMADVVAAFARAPVANPDGTTGIQLHLDTGSLYGANRVVSIAGAGGVTGTYGDLGGGGTMIAEAGNTIIDWDGATGRAGTSFYSLKTAGTNFSTNRAPVFRYALFAHGTNARRATNDSTSGWAEAIGCNDFFVSLGVGWTTDANGFSVGSRGEQAGTFMHELGHCLGLPHGGSDSVNFKPNYLSLMNYSFQSCSLPASTAAGLPGGCDYSRLDLDDLDETALDECLGLDPRLGFGRLDWNGDRMFQGSTCAPPTMNVSRDLNGDRFCTDDGGNGMRDSATTGDDTVSGLQVADGNDRTCQSTATPDDAQLRTVGVPQPNPLTSFDDWTNLVYNFRVLPSAENGVASPVPDEPDREIIDRQREDLAVRLAPDVVVELTGPATAQAGDTITYTLHVRNQGGGPALGVLVTETRPDGSTQGVDLGVLPSGAEAVETFTYDVHRYAASGIVTGAAALAYGDFVGNRLSVGGSFATRIIGGLNITKALVRKRVQPGSGSVKVTGDLLALPPDILTSASGLVVRVRDGLTLAEQQTWAASDCTTHVGAIRCKTADKLGQIRFAPIRRTPGLYRFLIHLKNRDNQPPFAAPVGVTLEYGALLERHGDIDQCGINPSGDLKCSKP